MSGPAESGAAADDANGETAADEHPSNEETTADEHPSNEETTVENPPNNKDPPATDPDDLPGAPMTKRTRLKSAALWGLVGGLSFLVLAQGYLLAGGDLPFRYAALFAVGAVVAALAAGLVYATEHRVRSKRRT